MLSFKELKLITNFFFPVFLPSFTNLSPAFIASYCPVPRGPLPPSKQLHHQQSTANYSK